MKRIIYVIPYTSIIDQTAEIFGNVFGKECVLEHHSGVEFEEEVGKGTDRSPGARALAVENWDAPIIITTSVQFFESLFSDRPSKCRKLHNIAGSVLVFDEAQVGLPQEHLLPLVKAISCLCANFECTALLSTATQPALEKLFEKDGYGVHSIELTEDPFALYSAFKRNKIEFVAQAISKEELAEKLAAEESALCVVNTRAKAQKMFSLLPEEGRFCLTTLVCPFYRKKMIADIRERLAKGLPCRVVSTSLIEAGVDLDFDAVFREEAGLDSLIQCAGRCNREGRNPPEGSFVRMFVFEGDKHQAPYCRRAFTRHPDDVDSPESVREYFETIRPSGEGQYDALDRCSVLKRADELAFRSIGKYFRLIEDDSFYIHVPIGEGESLVQSLREGKIDRADMRRLAFFTVPVHQRQAELLKAKGALVLVDDRHFTLQRLDLYDLKTGLSLVDEESSGLFF